MKRQNRNRRRRDLSDEAESARCEFCGNFCQWFWVTVWLYDTPRAIEIMQCEVVGNEFVVLDQPWGLN
ncbi:MAG: hypothetical protein E6Q97_37425 [Desulfurellales bacterium]|nr:MAG: hypothetical protein E6Q97_37425 [Desulfurellales bacterium]